MRVVAFILTLLVFRNCCCFAQTSPATTTNTSTTIPEHIEEVQLDAANGFFNRQFYELAIAEYKKYLEWFPTGSAVEESMYRIAESYHELGKLEASKSQYQAVQKAFPKGNYFARCNFRIGEMLWNDQKYAEALPRFIEAANRAESRQTRLTAKFYQARTLLLLNERLNAVPVFQELVKEEQNNPYRGFALIELGKALEAEDKPDEALVFYSKVLQSDASNLLKSEATLKAGSIQMKQHSWPESISLFEKLIQMDCPEEWKSYAKLQLIRANYQINNYSMVLKIITQSRSNLSSEAYEEVDLTEAHSLKLLKRYRDAATKYSEFIQKYPQSKAGESAAQERLLCLYQLNDDSWDAEAARFLSQYPNSKSSSRFYYLRANLAFSKNDFANAYQHFGKIKLSEMDRDRAAEILYKQAHSLVQMGQTDSAIAAWNKFVTTFPKHSLVPNALYQQAITCEAAKKPDEALRAYLRITKEYPESSQRENAIYRSALIFGEMKHYADMRSGFQTLIHDYPSTTFKTAAQYWTGWTLYEEKRFVDAVPLLLQARKNDPEAYAAPATSRIILSYYYLKDREQLIKELEAQPANSKPPSPEMYDWIARESFKVKDYQTSEKYFRKLLAHPDGKEWIQASKWDLANVLAIQNKWKDAVDVWEDYLGRYKDPSSIIATKLKLTRGYTALKVFDKAQETAEEVLKLQPEGKNNAEARFLLGELMSAQDKNIDAGKYYLSVAVLYDDADLTPRSLKKAIDSFQAAGETNQVATLQKELKAKYPNYKTAP